MNMGKKKKKWEIVLSNRKIVFCDSAFVTHDPESRCTQDTKSANPYNVNAMT